MDAPPAGRLGGAETSEAKEGFSPEHVSHVDVAEITRRNEMEPQHLIGIAHWAFSCRCVTRTVSAVLRSCRSLIVIGTERRLSF